MLRFGMGKDDWKYDEDAWNETEDGRKKAAPSPEKRCARCLHWADREATCRPWWEKALGERIGGDISRFSDDRRENRT